jgi:RNA polymerase sigma factor (sigma-70 family)
MMAEVVEPGTEPTLFEMETSIVALGGPLGKEIFQEMWVKLLKSSPRPRWSRCQIMKIAKNKLLDMCRYDRVRLHLSLTQNIEVEGPDETPQLFLEKREDLCRLRLALTMLSPKLRRAVEEEIYVGGTKREIAERLGVPVQTLLTRRKDAIGELRAILASSRFLKLKRHSSVAVTTRGS